MKLPKQVKVEQDTTHRLIPYRYSDRGRPILNLLAQDDDDLLSDLTELEGATNDRLLGESGRLPGVSTIELVSGFRLAHIVNASFTHPNPSGGRFNGAGRGAWYAAFEMQTAQTEVAFHRAVELKEVRWRAEEVSSYIDYLADFRHEFHDIREDADCVDCLDPNRYAASQTLGLTLLTSGSAGIVYPSVRRTDGVCIACFRPPLVLNVRDGPMVTFTFTDTELTKAVIES
ncbi:MAG: RES family NAD+ phosphorylase [Candidatus Sulfotelmatobacter sp.]|jgi:RES domain-containing protein